jgi:phage-related protein
MPLLTFTPSIRPSPGAQFSPEISLLKAEFGDGYTQSGPNGLNHIREIVALKWNGITLAQKTELDAFFRSHGGYKPFNYQVYGLPSVLKWTCMEWSSSSGAPFTYDAKLKQDFSLTA